MKKVSAFTLWVIALAALACEEQAVCYHNCPDDPDRICDSVDMEPGDGDRCEELAIDKCEENPDRLDDFGGEVMHVLVTCSGNETCGLPDWCLPAYHDR